MFSLILSLFILLVPQIASSPTGVNFDWLGREKPAVGNETIVGTEQNDFSKAFLPRAEPHSPQKIEESKSLGIETTARAALVFDKAAGEILFDKNSGEKLSLASLTKLMTALVILDEKPEWGKYIKLAYADNREGGIVYARPPEEVTMENLFKMMLVGSVNNAAAAIARSTGMTEEAFVVKMNNKARELDMNNTIFVDPTGLLPENKSTARDIAKLLANALDREEIKEAVVQKKYIFSPRKSSNTYYVKSTNELLWSFLNEEPYTLIGGKTGYIEESGYNLAVEVEREGHKIVAVVLGSASAEDRFKEVKGLTDWTFENYKWQ